MTFDALCEAFAREDLFEAEIAVPAIGNNPETQVDPGVLVPRLTRDVLVHTWDLARAVGADDRLDPRWCAMAYERLPDDPNELSASGMFATRSRSTTRPTSSRSCWLGSAGIEPGVRRMWTFDTRTHRKRALSPQWPAGAGMPVGGPIPHRV